MCPGDRRVAQIPEILKLATMSGGGGTSAPKPPSKPAPSTPAPKPATKAWPDIALLEDGDFGRLTKTAYQKLLAPKAVGNYTGLIDGVFGSMSIRAEQRWLKKLGHYKGLLDGKRGPVTRKALQSFLYDKGHYKGLLDGSHGPMTTRALQQYLNAQRRHY